MVLVLYRVWTPRTTLLFLVLRMFSTFHYPFTLKTTGFNSQFIHVTFHDFPSYPPRNFGGAILRFADRFIDTCTPRIAMWIPKKGIHRLWRPHGRFGHF